MRILFIGDVVGEAGCDFVRRHLPGLKKLYRPDAVIINGENSAEGNGCTPRSLDSLLDSGADVITLGNHSFRRAEVYDYLDSSDRVARPVNFSARAPGHGSCVFDKPGRPKLTVYSLSGNAGMEQCSNAFDAADAMLEGAQGITFIDFHAEATSEKICLALYLDGRVSGIAGTHTHIQTADERILPGGTGYITDAGMCGSFNSALGVDAKDAIWRFRSGMPVRFATDGGAVRLCGAVFDIDDKSGKTTSVERISIED